MFVSCTEITEGFLLLGFNNIIMALIITTSPLCTDIAFCMKKMSHLVIYFMCFLVAGLQWNTRIWYKFRNDHRTYQNRMCTGAFGARPLRIRPCILAYDGSMRIAILQGTWSGWLHQTQLLTDATWVILTCSWVLRSDGFCVHWVPYLVFELCWQLSVYPDGWLPAVQPEWSAQKRKRDL